jgi:hypothetical protein
MGSFQFATNSIGEVSSERLNAAKIRRHNPNCIGASKRWLQAQYTRPIRLDTLSPEEQDLHALPRRIHRSSIGLFVELSAGATP